MATDGSPLCDVGIAYPLAAEIGRQMTANVGNADYLCKVGLNAGPAIELARQITAKSYSAPLLASAMWNPTKAIALAILGTLNISGGGGTAALKFNLASNSMYIALFEDI